MTREDLIDEAWDWVCQRAIEEGDIDIDRDYVIIERWIDEYIEWRLNAESMRKDE